MNNSNLLSIDGQYFYLDIDALAEYIKISPEEMQHVKVPKHRVILPDELDDVLRESNVKTPTLFSKIDSQDPMARWIGARPGDVVEITGMCESSVENKRYRFCMADVTNG